MEPRSPRGVASVTRLKLVASPPRSETISAEKRKTAQQEASKSLEVIISSTTFKIVLWRDSYEYVLVIEPKVASVRFAFEFTVLPDSLAANELQRVSHGHSPSLRHSIAVMALFSRFP